MRKAFMIISLLIFITLTNKVQNKVTGALVTVRIGKKVIVIWNYLSKIQHRDLLPIHSEEQYPVQVLVSIITSSELHSIGQSESTLLNVSTLFISFYQWQQDRIGYPPADNNEV